MESTDGHQRYPTVSVALSTAYYVLWRFEFNGALLSEVENSISFLALTHDVFKMQRSAGFVIFPENSLAVPAEARTHL